MTDSSTRGPLVGIRILDLSEGVAGPFSTKLLGDMGADVVKVEKPGTGDESRSFGPFPDGSVSAESSASFFFLNTSKRSIILDLDTTEGVSNLAALTQHFDVVVVDGSEESLAKRGLDYAQFRSWNSSVILTTISAFGSFGPHSEYKSSHLINCATGGWANVCGMPGRPPLQTGGAISETLTGGFAAAATLLAVLGRKRHGNGEHVDVSAMESAFTGAVLPTLMYEYQGTILERNSNVGFGAGVPMMLPTREGTIGINALTAAQWTTLWDFFGRTDIADDPRYEGVTWSNPDERIDELRTALQAAVADRTAEELFHEAQTWRVPFGLVPDLPGLFAMPPMCDRGFFIELEHPSVGSVSVPGIPFKSTATTPRPYRPPMLGEHTDDVLAELADSPETRTEGVARIRDHSLPLAGLRVLDLSMFFAGPVVAQTMADAGAEVIKVESVQRVDGWRWSGSITTDGAIPWETSPFFNWVNRNKLGVTLNLKDPRGIDIIKRLVRDADVLIENYTPRVMSEFGLAYESLKEINPRLIMLSLSGFGAQTSWRDYVAFGMSIEQMSGVSHLTGYAGEEPLFSGTTGGDIFAGVMGANALFAAIHHRDVTNEGQHIDFSQLEAVNLYLGDVMTGWSLTGTDPGRTGNGHRTFSPNGIYPCADDRWIAITCRTDGEFNTLAEHIGRPDWSGAGAGYADVKQRLENCDDIDRTIGEWTRQQDFLKLMHKLQGMGVPAGAVLAGPELLDDPQLKARGALLAQDRPGLGEKHNPNQPYRFRCAPAQPNRLAPFLGEHSREVLAALAGLSTAELDELEAADVIGTVPMVAR